MAPRLLPPGCPGSFAAKHPFPSTCFAHGDRAPPLGVFPQEQSSAGEAGILAPKANGTWEWIMGRPSRACAEHVCDLFGLAARPSALAQPTGFAHALPIARKGGSPAGAQDTPQGAARGRDGGPSTARVRQSRGLKYAA